MSEIKLNTSDFRDNARQLSNLANRLDKVQRRLNRTFSTFTLSSKGIGNGQRIGTAADRLRSCQKHLNYVADNFADAEKYLSVFNPTDFDMKDVLAFAAKPEAQVVGATVGAVTGSASLTGETFLKDFKKKFTWKKDKKSLELLTVKGKVSGEVNAWKIGGSADCGWASGSYSVKALNAKGEASFNAGLYTEVVDENGNKKLVLNPQVSAEVGASVSVFEAEAQGKIGNKYIGADAGVKAEVLSAEAKAKLKISRDEATLKASAEANLVKVGATAGLTIGGTKVGSVGANFKVGAGAHANISYKDGSIKCDIGASLGIGFDLKFELNVKGAVKAVAKTAVSAIGGVKTVAKAASGVVKHIFGWFK